MEKRPITELAYYRALYHVGALLRTIFLCGCASEPYNILLEGSTPILQGIPHIFVVNLHPDHKCALTITFLLHTIDIVKRFLGPFGSPCKCAGGERIFSS